MDSTHANKNQIEDEGTRDIEENEDESDLEVDDHEMIQKKELTWGKRHKLSQVR